MSYSREYFVGFAGARDNYEVPAALAQQGTLSALVTDLYLPKIIAGALHSSGIIKSSAPRYTRYIELHQVIQVPSAFMADRYNMRKAISGQSIIANKIKSIHLRLPDRGLFLYAGYAYEAFKSASTVPKILFQYHPYREFERNILREDAKKWPELSKLVDSYNTLPEDSRNIREIELADIIVCASEFTATSLRGIVQGSKPIFVVPYGANNIFEQKRARLQMPHAVKRFLFVGTGLHRKGLHILLRSWSLNRPPNSRLTLVVRNVEFDITSFIEDIRGDVDIVSNISREQLSQMYLSHDVFVLPSLVEGFGHVILEALSAGCYVISTENSCLPTLKLPSFACAAVPASDVNALSMAMNDAAKMELQSTRESIARVAVDFTWDNFRRTIISIADSFG
ncbi:glycosyltransferase family 4 protein [Methylocystis sp. ATCC 49242]|uniref:glycosyltransferase family 4 protein n=1 Tax=Methylocystis sp. ATCC 49242 TaxID=622637 RepID=UPI0001F868DD|nr:glycosyltransferase family 4 protein [Methylocystis sp. ATCC 49242]